MPMSNPGHVPAILHSLTGLAPASLLERCRVLLATTPSAAFPRGAWGGNEAETHLSLLSRVDFPASTQMHPTGVTSLYVSWSDPACGEEIVRIAQSVPRIAYPGPSLAARLRGRLWRLARPALA